MIRRNLTTWAPHGLAALVATASAASSAQDHAFGGPADPATADRTIEITMGDNYFEPDAVEVAAGETIRFVLTNDGGVLHQFTLGPVDLHLQQQEEMAMMAEHGMLTDHGADESMAGMSHGDTAMTHDAPNTVLVPPGETGEVTWRFDEPTELEFASNLPGQYEAGMSGTITFRGGS